MRETKQLIARIRAAGGEVRTTKRNPHPKVYFQGCLVCVLPLTSGDWRALKNATAQLRRAGLDV